MKQQDGHIILSIEEYNKLMSENTFLKEELAQIKRLLFGKKNERFIGENGDNKQLDLFSGAVQPATEQEVVTEEITYERARKDKNKPVRRIFPAHLPRIEETVEPEDLPGDAVKLGEEITEILEYSPGKIFVRQIVRPKYIVKDKAGENQIVIAGMPSDLPLPRANASASLLAYFLVSKFVDHLPFHRILKIFKRQETDLSEATVNNWFSLVCKLMEPLYGELRKQVRQSAYIQADESPMPVQTQDKPGSTHKGYQWVYHSPPLKLVCFDYQKGRDRGGPAGFLEHFKGHLQTDGYAAYNGFGDRPDITLSACWAHVRRKFEQSLQNYPSVAEHVMGEIQKLYGIEEKILEGGLPAADILELRNTVSKPVIDALEMYLFDQKDIVLPKSDIGKAIHYALSLMPRLKVYLTDPGLLADNNLVENTIRPLALGRKNYMFAGSHESAQRIAMMYSFFGSCRLNGVEPYGWLKHTLENILDCNIQKLKELLPNFKK